MIEFEWKRLLAKIETRAEQAAGSRWCRKTVTVIPSRRFARDW